MWCAFTLTNYQQYSTVRCPISEDQFFNRDAEKKLITGILKRAPHIYFYTGPRNSGKTTLLLRCLQDLKVNEQPVNVCHLDLREFAFENEAEFKKRLFEKLSTWQDSIFNSFKKVSISFIVSTPFGEANVKQTSANGNGAGLSVSCLCVVNTVEFLFDSFPCYPLQVN